MSRYGTSAERIGARPSSRRPSEGGLAMILALTLLLLLMGTGGAVLLTTMGHLDRAVLNEQLVGALEVAETGVARAMYELERDQDLDATPGIGNVAGTADGGRYEVAAEALGTHYYRLRASGTVKGIGRTIEVVVQRPTSVYTAGLGARGSIVIGGNFTMDSFDARKGTYAQQAVNSPPSGGTYANQNGRVASNGSIELGPNTVIRGDARSALTGGITTHSRAIVTGSMERLPEPLDLPDPPKEDFEEAYRNNRNGQWTASGPVGYSPRSRALRVTSQTVLKLPPGTYFFSSIYIAGGANLVVTGETKIYVVGNVAVSGGSITNTTGQAKNLEIIAHPYRVPEWYVPPSPPTIELGGGAKMVMALYAPAYDVTIEGTGEYFGAVVGRRITAKSVDFHFDESLIDEENLTTPPRVRKYQSRAWRELTRPTS